MTYVLLNYNGEYITINLDSDDDDEYGFHDEPLNLPPLVEVKQKLPEHQQRQQQRHSETSQNSTDHQEEPEQSCTVESPDLFETADLALELEEPGQKMPPLIDVNTCEKIEEELLEGPKIVYKTLVAQGEKVSIAEHIVKEIPYIDTLFSGRFSVDTLEEGVVKSDEINPELLKVIVKYLESKKLYKLLACLPKKCDVFQLLELYHFLALPTPINTNTEDIRDRLKKSPSIYVTTQEELTHFVFAIFHAFSLVDYRKERKIRDMVYNTITYVFKTKNQSFKPRARYHMLKLATKCVWFSFNQYQKIRDLRVDENMDDSDSECFVHLFSNSSNDDTCSFEDHYFHDGFSSYMDSDDELGMMLNAFGFFHLHDDDLDDFDYTVF